MVIGRAIAAVCRDSDVLKHLGGTLGESARAKALELRELPDSKNERAMASAIAVAPIPAGLRAIHPTWIEAALAALPARARDDLASGGLRGTHVDVTGVWLARWAASGLVPMETDRSISRPRAIGEAMRMRVEKLVAWLADVGADQLAFALGPEKAAKVARVVGVRLVAAIERVSASPRDGALGARRAAIERSMIEMTEDALVVIGARAIAPYCDAIARRQIALKMPRTRGLEVLFELRAWRKRSIDTAPTWDALAAT